MSEVLTLCALGVRDAYLTGLKSRSCPTEGDSSTHGLLGFLLTTPHRTSFCMLGLIGVGLVGFVSLSVAVPKEGFGNHRPGPGCSRLGLFGIAMPLFLAVTSKVDVRAYSDRS